MEKQHIFRKTFPGLKVIHVFPHFHALGGVETVLHLHHAKDPALEIESEFIIYSESQKDPSPRLHFISISDSDSLAQIGSKVQGITRPRQGRTLVYEMLWAVPFFAPHDHASRRILVQHGDFPELADKLPKYSKYLDGIICVNPSLQEKVRALLPAFDPARIVAVDCPIDPPATPFLERPLGNPVKIGFSGRLLREQKRVELIPEFTRRLTDRGVNFVFEILGDGPERQFLEANLDPRNCKVHGLRQGEDYWAVIRSWDFIIYFSDYEGTPLSLLEAMSQGVIPIYPRLGSGGDKYVQKVHPHLLYPKGGGIEAAVESIAAAIQWPAEEILRLRQNGPGAIAAHSVPSYFENFHEHLAQFNRLPRISISHPKLLYRLFPWLTLRSLGKLTAHRTRALAERFSRQNTNPQVNRFRAVGGEQALRPEKPPPEKI